MNRDVSLIAIAVALVGLGVYRALYLPAMLAGSSTPLLFVGFLLEAVFGIAAGVAVWRGSGRAPLLIVLLGASVALTGLIEILLGVEGWLIALLGAALAIAVAWLVAWYVARRGATRQRSQLP